VLDGETLTVSLNPDIVGLEVFFAHQTVASGTMTFRNAGGGQVGSPLMTNGDCEVGPMPLRQIVQFTELVRTVEVTATGVTVWVDSFRVNP